METFRKFLKLTQDVIFIYREPSQNLWSFYVGQVNYMLSNHGDLPEIILNMLLQGNFDLEQFKQHLGEGKSQVSMIRLAKLLDSSLGDLPSLEQLQKARTILLQQVVAYFGKCWGSFIALYEETEKNSGIRLQL